MCLMSNLGILNLDYTKIWIYIGFGTIYFLGYENFLLWIVW